MVMTFSMQVRIVQTWACWNANSMNRVKKLFDYRITWDGKEVLIYLFIFVIGRNFINWKEYTGRGP